jgi:hypothetical protein
MRDDRDYEASLSREIDAWLRGDRSRRHVLAGLLGIGASAVAGKAAQSATAQRLGRMPINTLLQRAAVELASPDTPLGQAWLDSANESGCISLRGLFSAEHR